MDWTDTWQERGDSFNYAMDLFPAARQIERDLLIEPLAIDDSHALLEVAPSGSAFFSEGVRKSLGCDFRCRAIEPSPVFAERLPDFIDVIEDATFTDFNMPDLSFDRIVNLTGLHHSSESELRGFFSEAWRCLKPMGRLGVADVRKGSGVDEWLNGFVNTGNPQGHCGRFFLAGELEGLFAKSGFSEIKEGSQQYTWNFPSIEGMVTFCKHMFYLKGASDEEILTGIKKYLGYRLHTDGSVAMNWELVYCFGKRL